MSINKKMGKLWLICTTAYNNSENKWTRLYRLTWLKL